MLHLQGEAANALSGGARARARGEGEGEGRGGLSYQPSQKVLWSKQFGAPPVPSHFLQSSWPHVYELHLVSLGCKLG